MYIPKTVPRVDNLHSDSEYTIRQETINLAHVVCVQQLYDKKADGTFSQVIPTMSKVDLTTHVIFVDLSYEDIVDYFASSINDHERYLENIAELMKES